MTRDKAQKRAIRARMAKTGERYTAARHYHLDQHLVDQCTTVIEPEPVSGIAPLPARAAEPSMSDEAIHRRTGRTWDEWFLLLDEWRGAERTHPEIARHLAEEHGLGG